MINQDFKLKKIGVLMGGVSSEREISLRSGKNVYEALLNLGYDVVAIDITSRNCGRQIISTGIEVAFNILHGEFGEDGGVQQLLEELEIPYTGSGPIASANCMDKLKTRAILKAQGLPLPAAEQPPSATQIKMPAPLVVKAPNQGSSLGVKIVKDPNQVVAAYQEVVANYGEAFLEQFIAGVEVTVGVIGSAEQDPVALPILELLPKSDFYDFESKYTPGGTEFVLPAKLSNEVTQLVQSMAKKAFTALKCQGAARVDFIIEHRQTPYILEVNNVPGMTNQSDLPAEAKEAGISFEQLVEELLLGAGLGKY